MPNPRLRPVPGLRALAVFALLVGVSAFASPAARPWAVRVWRLSDGLPDDRLLSLAQTDEGYLWVVGRQAFARFDGASFDTFGGQDEPNPDLRGVQLVLRRRDGSLVLFNDGGTLMTANEAGLRVVVRGMPSGWAEALLEDGRRNLWVMYHAGIVGGRLYRIVGGRAQTFSAEDGLPGGMADAVACDRDGQIWIFRGGRLDVFRGGKFVTVLRLPDVRTRLAAARGGGLWIASGFTLYRYREGDRAPALEAVFGHVVRGIQGTGPSAILEDRSGAVWIGTTASGLFRFDGRQFESIPISHREVISLLEDREGSVWVATKNGGLNQIQPRTILVEGSELAVPSEAIQAVCEAPDGRVFAVTQDGRVVARADGSWTPVFPPQPTLLEGTCIAADRQGALWIGTKAFTLYRWMDGKLTQWRRHDGIACHTVRCLMVARDGTLWISGEGPGFIAQMREGRLIRTPVPPGADFLRGMAQDAAGDVWVAGNRGHLPVLLRISHGVLTDESSRVASVGHPIPTLAATADGSVWMGFAGAGIGRLKDGRFTYLRTAQGLADDNVSTIAADDRDGIWCAGGTSIFKIRQGEVDALAAGTIARIECVKYGSDQGLPPQHLAYGDAPRAVRFSDGRIWVPMATELAIIDPRIERPGAAGRAGSLQPPPILITELSADGDPVLRYAGTVRLRAQPAPLSGAPEIPPGTRDLEVDFTSLSLYSPQNVHFRYRLVPYDERWTDPGPVRRAVFSHLPHGRYRFEVMACSSDGIWNAAPAALAFAVEPFLWERWWFRGAIAVALAGAMYILARYIAHRRLGAKLRSLEKQAALDQERARIARNIHDDLGSRLTKIVLLTGLVARDRAAPQKAGERNREISDLARQMLASLDETVWAVNPRNDTLPHLIDYLGHSAVNFLRTAEIPCQVELPEDTPTIRISSDVRHHIFLTVQEALNNVVRHAHASVARLRITLGSEALRIAIEDDGRGFAAVPDDPEADGLRNMRERMRQIGGTFTVESRVGHGTRIDLAIPRGAWG